jgi:nicotinamidase-related amidase
MSKALVVIDVQNDYFPGGQFPLWNAEATLERVEAAVRRAAGSGVPVILVQHVADPAAGVSPFFNRGTRGAELHPRLLEAAPGAPIVVKSFADSFEQTSLEETLGQLGATELAICGMMTQNCVTHTAISRTADKYDVTILPDACTTVTELLHQIALHAVSTRVRLVPSSQALG